MEKAMESHGIWKKKINKKKAEYSMIPVSYKIVFNYKLCFVL